MDPATKRTLPDPNGGARASESAPIQQHISIPSPATHSRLRSLRQRIDRSARSAHASTVSNPPAAADAVGMAAREAADDRVRVAQDR